MRPLYWTRIQVPPCFTAAAASQGQDQTDDGDDDKDLIVWEELDETPIEVDEFDQLFSRPVMKAKAKKDKKKDDESKPKKTAVAKYLDPRKSQDAGIFIKSNKLDIVEVENTVYNFDNSTIDFEVLVQVQRIAATPEELAVFQDHVKNQPDVPLDKVEQFLLDLAGISHFSERLRCIMFQTRLADSMADIEYRLNNVSHVCDQLLNSTSMKQVINTVILQFEHKVIAGV
jgi:formin 2